METHQEFGSADRTKSDGLPPTHSPNGIRILLNSCPTVDADFPIYGHHLLRWS
jgi:hypothetical protein